MTENFLERANLLEREAHELRSRIRNEEAFVKFDKAASLYSKASEYLKAALCFASAASCWNIHTGHQPLRNAASRNALAAREALKAGHYDYARSLFGEAAILYEKEGDFGKFSDCFYRSKHAEAKFSWAIFARGRKDQLEETGTFSGTERVAAFARWVMSTANRLIWGYGERPFRTFLVALFIITVSAALYALSGQIRTSGEIRPISLLEGLYMSVITYTTVGFGDYLPVGWTRGWAMLEALSGIFFAPLFLVALTRRYLRMYR